jgi:Arc/MetJ-type ribon-helix-helix transcriptional regulator
MTGDTRTEGSAAAAVARGSRSRNRTPVVAAQGSSGIASRRTGSGRRKTKVSVTVDSDLWDEVRSLVDADDAVETASSAVEEGLSLWVANHRLGRALDALYEEDPAARPSDEEVRRAAEALGL